jgi:hypothetical protein
MAESDIVAILVSIISLISSVVVAIITYILNKTQSYKLEDLKSKLAAERSKEDALREYTYNARKRLYEECEPILFQLYELSEAARRHVSQMAMRAREGHLRLDSLSVCSKELENQSEEKLKESKGWLSFPNTYFFSTIYILLAPMAAFKILQSRLTSVDLEVDPSIETIYLLAKHLYGTFSADRDLANIPPKIEYDEHGQGIYALKLDNMTEALIEYYYEPDKSLRLKSFGKFTSEYIKEKKVEPPFNFIYNIFLNFHPSKKPVLWRILIAQLYLYDAIKHIYDIKKKNKNLQDSGELPNYKCIKTIPEKERREELDWRKNSHEAKYNEVLVDPFAAVECYLQNSMKLKNLIERTTLGQLS